MLHIDCVVLVVDNEQIVDNISKDGAKGQHEQRRREDGEEGGSIEQGRG